MTSENPHLRRALTALSLLAALVVSGPAIAGDAVPIPAARTTAPAAPPDPTDASSVKQTYDSLQGIWEAIYKVEDVTTSVLNEGKFWTPRKDWLDYYSTVMGQGISVIQQDLSDTKLPPDKQALVAADWAQMQQLVADMNKHYADFQTSIQGDANALSKTPYHGPAKAVDDDTKKLDVLLLGLYTKLCPGGDAATVAAQAQAMTGTNQAPSASTVQLSGSAQALAPKAGVQAIGQAADKMHKAAFGLIGELERWNLLWGQPPPGGPANYLYGGGLTPKEIESQYRYLPQVAFTMPTYVQRMSYRLAPREKMLVMYTTEIGKLINLMNQDIQDTKLPPEREPALRGPWGEVQVLFKDTMSSYMELLKMVNTATDDRLKKNIREDEVNYGKPTVAIYDNMDKIQKVLADVNQIIKQ